MIAATVRFYEELNFFLKGHEKKRDIQTRSLLPRSVKDLIESFGIPHVEVDLILINGSSQGFDYLVQDGDRISVYPVFERLNIAGITKLRPEPLRNPRFVVDVHLKTLARRLRMLGFDVVYDPTKSDRELATASQADRRILLTRDRQLLMRSIVTRGLYVRSTDPAAQTPEIIERLDLYSLVQPFARCIDCNGLIGAVKDVDWDLYKSNVPAGVKAWCSEFYVCDSCEKVYWKGGHYQKMTKMVEKILGAREGNNSKPTSGGEPSSPAQRSSQG